VYYHEEDGEFKGDRYRRKK